MEDSIWERYHACRRIWDAFTEGDEIAGIHASTAKHYGNIVKEIKRHWMKENLMGDSIQFEEAYCAWLRKRP